MPPVPLPNRRDGDTLPPSSWEETKRFLNEREGAETKADPHPEFVHLGKGTGSEVEVQERQDKKAAAAAHFPKNPNRTSRRTPSCLPPLLPLKREEDSCPAFAEKRGKRGKRGGGGRMSRPHSIPAPLPSSPPLSAPPLLLRTSQTHRRRYRCALLRQQHKGCFLQSPQTNEGSSIEKEKRMEEGGIRINPISLPPFDLLLPRTTKKSFGFFLDHNFIPG